MGVNEIFESHRLQAPAQAETSVKYRLDKLEQLRAALKGPWREKLATALEADFGKSAVEVGLTEIFPTLDNLALLRKNLRNWLRVKKVKTPLPLFGTSSYTRAEPKGTTLVIAPWNYPIFLSLHPLSTSFAAGNTVILKPSEMVPHTSAALAELIAEIFTPEEVTVVQGGVEVATELLQQPFNHIFFTGSTEVGKIVMKAASAHLTSVTLELGGKSPTIVDRSARAYEAGQRIAWAKFTNAGQICIAPDHVYVHQSKVDDFRRGVLDAVTNYYGPEAIDSTDYVKLVHDRHYHRLVAMADEAAESGTLWSGGERDEAKRKLAPTVVFNPRKDAKCMKEEIFGPLLPVFSYDRIEDVLEEINSREHPLVVYIYSNSKKSIRKIQLHTRAGATAVNMSLLQIANNHLPFGGVGHSGMGKTNGHSGFLEFTNTRSEFYQWGVPVSKLLSAPYTKGKQRLVNLLIKYLY